VSMAVSGEADVAARFAEGDPDAVRVVYQTYGRLVYSVAYKVLGDAGLAEDATQQTFMQAWRAAGSYDPSRELGPWLATIARRAAINVYRHDKRHRSFVGLDSADPALVSPPPEAEQIYDVWEVRRALDTLPAQDRELIRLQHYRELTHTEIAEHLAIPIGTVKSRTFRAHRRLAGLLAHLRAGPDDEVVDVHNARKSGDSQGKAKEVRPNG
jgi:RNA polymerase sigma-70 factor (ECF subfamily)